MLSFISRVFSGRSNKVDVLDRTSVVAALSINPHLESSSAAINSCVKLLKEKGLHPEVNDFSTTIKGNWKDIDNAVRECHRLLHAQGIRTVSTDLHLRTKVDDKSLAKRLAAV